MLASLTLNDLLTPLALFGFAGQFVFMLRFVVQWLVSERRGRSHVPVAFWYLSIVGGLMLLAYATIRRDPVFMFGQALGLLIYVRNLVLIYRRQSRLRWLQHRTAGRSLTTPADPGRPAAPGPAARGPSLAPQAAGRDVPRCGELPGLEQSASP